MDRDCSINNKNTWDTWGAEMMDGYLEALLTPPAAKDYIENESRAEHGIRITAPEETCLMADRELSISVLITGSTVADYLAKYASFVEELTNGKLALKVPTLGKVFNLYYLSCSKYGSYGKCRGKFTIKLKEPNPADREDVS